MGVATLSGGKEVFVPVNQFSVFAEISLQCTVPSNKVVLLMDNTIIPNAQYVKRVRELKEQGYSLLATGEMGIGNTTTSSAVTAVLLGREPADGTRLCPHLGGECPQRFLNL